MYIWAIDWLRDRVRERLEAREQIVCGDRACIWFSNYSYNNCYLSITLARLDSAETQHSRIQISVTQEYSVNNLLLLLLLLLLFAVLYTLFACYCIRFLYTICVLLVFSSVCHSTCSRLCMPLHFKITIALHRIAYMWIPPIDYEPTAVRTKINCT